MGQVARRLAVVTGASSGIGLELARIAAAEGYDVLVAARDARVEAVATELRKAGGGAYALETDLSSREGVDALYDHVAAMGRPIDLLFANAGRGLGRGFLDQSMTEIDDVLDTNIYGTVYLLHKIARDMRTRGTGKILITGSVAGFIPGTYQAVYNATKAFVDSFANALGHELKDTGVSVTCLMPGATETEFFEKAHMMDTKVGTDKKDEAAAVARTGYDALMRGDSSIVHGFRNKVQVAVARVIPQDASAAAHEKLAAPGTASK